MQLLQTLVRSGQLLYGKNWQLPISRALGKYHPSGARDRIDPRLVRRWFSTERPVPAWVLVALTEIMKDRARTMEQDLGKLKNCITAIQIGARKGQTFEDIDFDQ